jgi:hypothetical protein
LAATCKSRKILVNAERRIGMRKHPSAVEFPEQPLEKPIRIRKRRGRWRLSINRGFAELTAIQGIGRRGGRSGRNTIAGGREIPSLHWARHPILTSSDANNVGLVVSQQIRQARSGFNVKGLNEMSLFVLYWYHIEKWKKPTVFTGRTRVTAVSSISTSV